MYVHASHCIAGVHGLYYIFILHSCRNPTGGSGKQDKYVYARRGLRLWLAHGRCTTLLAASARPSATLRCCRRLDGASTDTLPGRRAQGAVLQDRFMPGPHVRCGPALPPFVSVCGAAGALPHPTLLASELSRQGRLEAPACRWSLVEDAASRKGRERKGLRGAGPCLQRCAMPSPVRACLRCFGPVLTGPTLLGMTLSHNGAFQGASLRTAPSLSCMRPASRVV